MSQQSCNSAILLDLLASHNTSPDRLVIGVTSALRKEGRTRLACGLAETLAKEMEQVTLLIDLNYEQPLEARQVSLSHYLNLGDNFQNTEQLQEASPKLWLLGAGGTAPRQLQLAAALLKNGLPFDNFSATIGADFVVVLDLPPILDSPLGLQLVSLANYLILAVRSDLTTTKVVKDALMRLEEAGHRHKLSHSVLIGARQRTPKWFARLGLG